MHRPEGRPLQGARRFLFASLLLCLFVPSAFAQITTVSGTVTDPNGLAWAGAQIKAQIVLAGSPLTGQPTVTVNSNAQCKASGFGSAPCQVPFIGTVGPTPLDGNGKFSMNLPDNTQVTPGSTQWQFTVSTQGSPPPLGTGSQSFSNTFTVSGSSQTLTFTNVPALGVVAGLAGNNDFTGWVGVGNAPDCLPSPTEELFKICQTNTANKYAMVIQTSAGANPNFNALYLNYTGQNSAIGADCRGQANPCFLVVHHGGASTWGQQLSTASDANAAAGNLQLNGASGQTGNLLQWTLNGNQTFAGKIDALGYFQVSVTHANAIYAQDATFTSRFRVNTSANLVELPNGTKLVGYSDNFATSTAQIDTSTGAATFKTVNFGTSTFASLGAVPPAGTAKYCTDCTTAATCAGAGTGHLAVSNGTNWTCQ